MPTFGGFPGNHTQQKWILHQHVEVPADKCLQEYSYPASVERLGIVAYNRCPYSPKPGLELLSCKRHNLAVETQLIAEVVEDQAFVVPRFRGNRIDARSIESVFRENFLRRINDRLTRHLCIPPPLRLYSAWCHLLFLSIVSSNVLSNQLVVITNWLDNNREIGRCQGFLPEFLKHPDN